jgi:exonuclease 3'-5' domain-containing protein 1
MPVNVIDMHTLGNAAFHTAGVRGKTLKNVLESPEIRKVFFDVRNDSDALYAHYGIDLRGVLDIQLMESANRQSTQSREFVSGLSKCIESILIGHDRDQWKLRKETGDRLWNPDKGGSYSVFNARPLSNEILAYCAGDVQYLPALYKKYKIGTNRWQELIAEASQNRVSASQKAGYQPDGPHKVRSSWTSEQNKILDTWGEVNQRHGGLSSASWDVLDEDEPQDWDDFDDGPTSCRDIISDSDYAYYYSD